MERHKLWNDRAEKLMKKTFESWSKGKKKKVYEDEEWGYDEEGNSLNPDDNEGNENPSQEVYTMVDKLKMHVGIVDMDEDAREYISDELSMILDKMDANVGNMNEEDMSDETEDPEVARAAEDAKKAKIKAVKAQLDALQKK